MNKNAPIAVPAVLGSLVGYLEGLTARAPLDALAAYLRDSRVTVGDVRDFLHFEAGNYCRNLIVAGPWYDLLVLCWRSGQRSPIHDHARSSCAFKVLTGVCSETVYGLSPCGQVVPLRTDNRCAGSIVATQDADTHQVSNLQPTGMDLVTLHIYTPPLRSMHLFSILGGETRNSAALAHADPAHLLVSADGDGI